MSQRTTGRSGGAARDGEEGGKRVPPFMANNHDLNPRDLRSWACRTGLHFSAAATACDNPPRKIPYYRLRPIHFGH
jgi:nucleobase transporter 1/2